MHIRAVFAVYHCICRVY